MIFEVIPEQIEGLSDGDLRTLVGYLAEQEVVRAGHSAAGVTYGGHQNAQDGGIDVRVDLATGATDGFVPRLQTGFQVKAEEMPVGKIQREMCPGGTLRTAIFNLGAAGGAYIIVSSKDSLSDSSLGKRRNAMTKALSDVPSASGLHVDFYDSRRVATWVNQHPGLVLWVRHRIGHSIAGWRPYEDWSSSPSTIDQEYLVDDGVRLVRATVNDSDGLEAVDGLNALRTMLTQPKGIVRLVGLSGVGKTRMVQALFDSRLGSGALSPRLAVYTDITESPSPGPIELLGQLQARCQPCVLIVDNCGIDLHRKLTARINTGATAISLLTVEFDVRDDEPENTDVFRLEPASSAVIERIIKRQYSNLSPPELRTIADFSEGNFRVALALANTARDGESLANLKDDDLFKRLFRQRNEDNPALLRAAKVCSLVYSFDGETTEGDVAELPILAALAEQTISELHGHVAELYRRQLVQKRANWCAVLPHAIAHKLAKHALEDLPLDQLRMRFEAAPDRLLKSFSRRLGYLHDSKGAETLVTGWLSNGGWFSDIGSLNDLGMALLRNVAPVNPSATLNAIQAAADRRGDFFEVNQNRAKLVELLRSLAYDAALFDQSTTLISQFARVEPDVNSVGDARNTLRSLFTLYLSGTHAPASQRAAIVYKLATSAQQADKPTILAALDAMLQCGNFSSGYSFEFGARKRDYGFHPQSPQERGDWYRAALCLCRDLSGLPGFRRDVRSMLASQFEFLVGPAPVDDLIAIASDFASDGGWPEGWAGVRRAIQRATEAKADHLVAKLQALEAKLKPISLSERITSYVLPPEWGALDVAEVELGDEEKYRKAQDRVSAICEGIGTELAKDLDALATHLPEILSSQSSRVVTVARAIGRETPDPRRAWEIICREAPPATSAGSFSAFPGCFLWGLSGKNRELVETMLEDAVTSEPMHPFLVHMQVSVGVDGRGCERLVKATKLPNVPTYTFGCLAQGRSCDLLSGEDFKRLLLAIADREDGLETAIKVLLTHILSLTSDARPVSGVEREIGRLLLGKVSFESIRQRDLYKHSVTQLAKTCLVAPDDEEFAKQLCGRLRDASNQWRVSWNYNEFVSEMAAIFPRVVLDIFVEGTRDLFIQFSDHQPAPLSKIDDALLLGWAHEKPDSRFVLLAELITPWVDRADFKPASGTEAREIEWKSTAMRLIREAPDPVAVLKRFLDRVDSGRWTGSLADILAKRLPVLEQLKSDPDQRIAKWAREAGPSLEEDIKAERARAAKRGRAEAERFE